MLWLCMSQCDIEDTLKEIYGSEILQGLISRITDKILPEVNEWQNRPLASIYPFSRLIKFLCKCWKKSQYNKKFVVIYTHL